jgi:hypothetical protein
VQNICACWKEELTHFPVQIDIKAEFTSCTNQSKGGSDKTLINNILNVYQAEIYGELIRRVQILCLCSYLELTFWSSMVEL